MSFENVFQVRAALFGASRVPVIRRRTALAFSLALGVTIVGGLTIFADIKQVLAFADESAASFFRADRERARGARPAPAAVYAPAAAYAPAPRAQGVPTKPAKAQSAAPISGYRALTIPPLGVEGLRPEDKREDKRDQKREARAPETIWAPKSTPIAGRSVCVRLCDGYHFPIGANPGASDIAGQEAVCASACPDSPTRLYLVPAGSEDISDAYSARGAKSYAALPVALRHTSTRDNTCTCRRNVSHVARLSHLTDATLRPGDAVMTHKGFRFLRGARQFPFKDSDFSGIESSRLSRSERVRLQAMERASLPQALRREQPLSTPRTTASPVPTLGPFLVRRPASGRTNADASPIPQSGSVGG